MAFENRGLREEMGHRMHGSGITRERKLELSGLLHGLAGQHLVQVAAGKAGITPDSLRRLADGLPALEFYMPVRGHRAKWTGEDVYVVSQLRKTDPIVGFDESGAAIALDVKTPPVVPTFAIVPSETDFRAAHAASGPGALLDETCDPTTAIIPCDPDANSGLPMSIPAAAPTGLYMTYSDIPDLSEYWWEGAPEMEVHILGPQVGDANNQARDLSCSGQTQSGWYWFNQNDAVWSGGVLLMTGSDLYAHGFNGGDVNRGFAIAVYEDDDQACVIHDDPVRLLSDLADAAGWSGITLMAMLGCGIGGGSDASMVSCLFTMLASGAFLVIHDVVVMLENNDDFIGFAIPIANVPGYTNPNATHALVGHGNAINGGIALVYHVFGTANR